jgi:hypothetical protein
LDNAAASSLSPCNDDDDDDDGDVDGIVVNSSDLTRESCLDADRGERERAGDWQTKKLNMGLDLNCGEAKLRLEVSFPPCFSICIG